MESQAFSRLVASLAERLGSDHPFADVRIEDGRLVCRALGPEEPAFYRVERDDEGVWVSLVTPDRWLSESIEAQLMHTGDSIEELLDEELVDQGFDAGPLAVQHFRSDDMLFTFRSRVDDLSPEALSQVLLAYEACFRQLGDMSPGEED